MPLITARPSREARVVFVNIPSASLFLYNGGKRVLESRIIVGKPSTPTLSSTITEVILYPYWNVPEKIALNELLPPIKRNTAYLEANNFQVLDKKGRVVNPWKINWHSLGAGNFPYSIRQSTGCDNSLGVVKLNFYNPFSVYLHDTPWKGGFWGHRRYLSHGCMRVEKALDQARVLLKNNTKAIDTLTEQCLPHHSPVILKAGMPVKLFVLYSTVWYDASGQVQFFPDIYGKIPWQY